MMRWSLILGAILTWALVLGCVVWPTETADRAARAAEPEASHPAAPTALSRSRDGLPLCAVAMQIQRLDWIDKYKQSMDEIAALGADGVLLVIDTRVENVSTARIWLDVRTTPTPDQLSDLIHHAKSKGLRVILMPVVLLDNPKGNDWRGVIAPDDDFGGWTEWFKSYRDMMNHFSWIAEGNGVDVLVVGSELISAEPHVDEWTRVVKEVRERYHGRLTYSSNWDHYHQVKIWDQLDLIGMNSYWDFGSQSKPNPSVEEINKRWKEIQTDLLAFVKKSGKPLLFLEIGWFSQDIVAWKPWDYTLDKPLDLELQRKLYQAFFETWWGNPQLGGFCVWEWPPGAGGREDKGYTPEHKPAENVLREYLAKPRWKVE